MSVIKSTFAGVAAVMFIIWYFVFWQGITPSGNDATVLQETFDTATVSSFGQKIIENQHTKRVDGEGVDGSAALKVFYVGDERGSKRVLASEFISATDKATLSFSVNFCPGFDFARGGKLHGLGPVKPVSGGNAVKTDRWSARLMWSRNGILKTYVYHQDMKGKFGDGRFADDFIFNPGQYYKIDMTVTLNSKPELADGYVDVLVDGKQVIHHDRLRFRSTSSSDGLISRILFSTFHGGSSPEWAPRNADGSFKTDCAYFDNFTVTHFPASTVSAQ